MSMHDITQLEHDLNQAAKARDQIRLSVLRLLKASLKNYEIEVGHDATPQEIMAVLQKEAKKRTESITQYQQAGRDDLVDSEQKELDILNEYLPESLTEKQIDEFVTQAIQETGASQLQDLGKVMPVLMKKTQGSVDGAVLSAKVKAALSE